MDFSKYGGASREWKAVEAEFPAPPPSDLSVVEKRAAANAQRETTSAALMKAGLADKVELIDITIYTRDGFPLEARLYWPDSVPRDAKPAVYIHLHGGGYLFGTLSSEDAICANLAVNTADKGTQVVVLNVNYRHTPEWTYPTAWHDAQDAFAWACAQGVRQYGFDSSKIVMGGISAGAHITASIVLAQHLRQWGAEFPKIAGQVLMIPALVNNACYEGQVAQLASPEVSSLVENEFAPILPMTVVHFFTDLLKIPTPIKADDLFLSPGNATAEQVKGLPPAVFGVCGLDPLRDEGMLYAKLLAEKAGVPTNVHVYRGVPHGFRRYGPERLSVSRDWDATMEDGIAWALSKPTATNKLDIIVHGEDTM